MEPYPKAYLYRRIAQAKRFIDAHYTEAIHVDLICGEAAFSKSHFIRLFKQAYGCPPRVYLSRLRLDRAQLLLDEGASVAEACHAVGFQSLPTFSRAFKQRTGSSPSAWRRQRAERARRMSARPLEHIPTCYAQWLGWAQMRDPG